MKLIKEWKNLKKRLKKQIKKFIKNQFHQSIFGDAQYFIQEQIQIVKNTTMKQKNQKLKIALKTFKKMEIALN